MDVDIDFLEKEYGEKITQRQRDFKAAIQLFDQEFKSKHPRKQLIYSIEEITIELAVLYFHWSYHIVRPFVKNLSDRYKIASNTEFSIIYLQPLSIVDGSEGENLQINAAFAFYVALNIILNFDPENDAASRYKESVLNFKGGIAPLEDIMIRVMENHRRYMTTFNPIDTPPIILNGFVWEMIDMFYKFQWQAQAI